MLGLDNLETLFVVTAFVFQIVLVMHYSLRKWRFHVAMRYGWIVYALSVPAAAVSSVLLLGGVAWWLWLGGFLYLVWAAYGYTVDYVKQIEWRVPIRWPVAGPYLSLYLATEMFFWWPLWQVHRALWYVQAALYVLATVLNLTSHRRPVERRQPAGG
jgi:hypothetical protein